MLLFVASANVGYSIFTYSNEKFTNVFVRAFTKSDATGLHFGKPRYRLQTGKLSCNSEPDSMLFALALQIASV